MNVKPLRDPIVMTLERPLAAFGRPNCIFVDKDAQEIHAMSSSHMDARPFKDPNFELQRVLLDKDVQAVPVIVEECVQVRFLPHPIGCITAMLKTVHTSLQLLSCADGEPSIGCQDFARKGLTGS